MIGKSLGGVDEVKDLTENCRDCIYYGKNLDNCDYFEIRNALRPCPPGDECTVKVSKSRTPDVFGPEVKPKRGGSQRKGVTSWDTERAYRLWMEGLPTGHIAEMVGISGSTLSGYATKHGWPRENRPKQGQWNKEWRTIVKEENDAGAGSTGKEETQAAHEGAAGGHEETQSQCDRLGSDPGSDGQAGSEAQDPWRTEGDQEVSELKKLAAYEVAEACTDELSGIWAVCTADAVMCLQNWKDREDLIRAKNAIEYMIRRMEASNGTV